jgi:hypothetical protein
MALLHISLPKKGQQYNRLEWIVTGLVTYVRLFVLWFVACGFINFLSDDWRYIYVYGFLEGTINEWMNEWMANFLDVTNLS